MRAVVYHGPAQVAVEQLPEPGIAHPRDAIVRVSRTAICGTDLHPYRGELTGFPAGTVLGHEFAGVVLQAGPDVPFAVGQRVYASDIIACGRCADCAKGWHYQCAAATLFGYATVVGAAVAGGQAELVRIPFADVVLAATPDDVTDEQALLAGDALTTGYAAARNAAIIPGAVVAVVGGGPVGLLAALCASTMGAAHVVVADPEPDRRMLADSAGLTSVAPEGLAAATAELTGGRGAHAVIEAVGTDAALGCALGAAGPHSTVSVAGAHHSSSMPFPSGLCFRKELTLRFTVGDPIAQREEVLALVRSGRLDPAAIISHRLPLQEAAAAYELFASRRAFKVVLIPDMG